MLYLSPRLLMVAEMTRENKALCDVGTDHAYLPVFLLQRGLIPYAFAGDINEGPLRNARQTLEKYGYTDKVELILGSGLLNFSENCAGDFVIAGMGGELIARILSESTWVQKSGNHFVLQPQSHAEDLREYLTKNGYRILRERVCKEGKHLYIAMEVEFSGESMSELIPNGMSEDDFFYTGKLKDSDSELKNEYFMYIKSRLAVRASALEKSGKDEETVLRLKGIIDFIDKTLLTDEALQTEGNI